MEERRRQHTIIDFHDCVVDLRGSSLNAVHLLTVYSTVHGKGAGKQGKEKMREKKVEEGDRRR